MKNLTFHQQTVIPSNEESLAVEKPKDAHSA